MRWSHLPKKGDEQKINGNKKIQEICYVLWWVRRSNMACIAFYTQQLIIFQMPCKFFKPPLSVFTWMSNRLIQGTLSYFSNLEHNNFWHCRRLWNFILKIVQCEFIFFWLIQTWMHLKFFLSQNKFVVFEIKMCLQNLWKCFKNYFETI